MQTDYSMVCYHGYLRAQEIRDAIDGAVGYDEGLDEAQRDAMRALRGSGAPGDPDILYGSIYASPADEETVVGLQHKFLFLLNVLQGTDARPTSQAMDGVRALQETLEVLTQRWDALR